MSVGQSSFLAQGLLQMKAEELWLRKGRWVWWLGASNSWDFLHLVHLELWEASMGLVRGTPVTQFGSHNIKVKHNNVWQQSKWKIKEIIKCKEAVSSRLEGPY